MSPFFTVAFIVAVTIFAMVRFILKAVQPAYQQVMLRSVYAISVIVIIMLAAYWLLNSPTATASVKPTPPA